MVGFGRRETVEDVEGAWREWAERHGLAGRIRRGDRTTDLRPTRRQVKSYVSGGKWIADCPDCNGGIACWIENPRGACLDCGTIFRVNHPSQGEADRAEELLCARPDPATRSWHRHLGETIEDLERENAERLSPHPSGVVDLSEVVRVLGDKAYAQLVEEGVA